MFKTLINNCNKEILKETINTTITFLNKMT